MKGLISSFRLALFLLINRHLRSVTRHASFSLLTKPLAKGGQNGSKYLRFLAATGKMIDS